MCLILLFSAARASRCWKRIFFAFYYHFILFSIKCNKVIERRAWNENLNLFWSATMRYLALLATFVNYVIFLMCQYCERLLEMSFNLVLFSHTLNLMEIENRYSRAVWNWQIVEMLQEILKDVILAKRNWWWKDTEDWKRSLKQIEWHFNYYYCSKLESVMLSLGPKNCLKNEKS